MSVSMLTSVHTGSNETGTSRVYGVSSSARYNQLTSPFMISEGISNNLTSARVHRSNIADGTLILFRPFSPTVLLPDYDGLFMQITDASGTSAFVDTFPALFNNKTTTGLLVAVNKSTEIPMSFRDLFLSEWNKTIDGELGSDASRKGGPLLTWAMFPRNVSHLDSNRRYLKIHQRLTIHVPWWPDYDASITYHVHLYLNSAGRLRGNVARWAYWIEGGIKSGAISGELKPKVIAGMNKLDEKLDEKLDGFPSTFSDLYFLPGRQTSLPGNGVVTGLTTDDVTIVVQL